MKKILIATIFLSNCKASDVAAPAAEPVACEILTAEFITADDEVIDCQPESSTIYSQGFQLKSDQTACGFVFDLDDNLVSSNCESRWERESCSTINYYGPSDSSLTKFENIVKTEQGFSASLTLTDSSQTYEATNFNCRKLGP